MNEKFRPSHESESSLLDTTEQKKDIAKKIEKAAEKTTHEHKKSVDEIREKIEKEARSSETIQKNLDNNKQVDSPISMGVHLRRHSVKDTIKRVQSRLSPTQRVFSKVVHNPTLDTISEFSGKTVARPSGLLYGGIFSFVFSLGFLYLAKYYGYEYNFFIGILAFIAGFFLGLLIESISTIIRKKL